MTDGTTGAEYVYDALRSAGVEVLVGLPGTQTLPLDRVVAERDAMEYVMARHETAIPHVAWGYHEAGGGLAATLTVPGPGDTNAMHGLKNALEDCVPMVHVAADPDPADRGKGPIHEIESDTFDNAVKENVVVERPRRLREAVERGLAVARSPPTGPVRLGIPSSVLADPVDAPAAAVTPERRAFDSDDALREAARHLRDAERPLVYVGGGVRRAAGGTDAGARAVRDLVDGLNVPVITSYKGKGVIPEDDPHSIGVTASYLPAGALAVLEAADVVLALGTDFDGVTTANWSLPMGEVLIHATLDPDAVDASYDADVAIVEDAATVARDLRERVEGPVGWDGAALGPRVREEYRAHLDDRGLLDERAPATTPATLRAVRRATPREATIVTDIGGHRLWAMELFPAYGPHRYVTAGSWAGMGVGLPAALGAKLARPDDPVVCLHGDGGLMMCLQELHTAADYGLDVVVVVFDDADYGIISKDPALYDGDDRRFAWDAPDFVSIAEGFGCRGVRAETAAEAGEAVEEAVADDRDVPTLVDVSIRGDEPTVKDVADYPTELP